MRIKLSGLSLRKKAFFAPAPVPTKVKEVACRLPLVVASPKVIPTGVTLGPVRVTVTAPPTVRLCAARTVSPQAFALFELKASDAQLATAV